MTRNYSLREIVVQGFLESGWREEDLRKSLSEEERYYLPTFPEFAGIVGKVYLNTILRHILPGSLHFAWGSLKGSLDLARWDGKSLDLSELLMDAGRPATLQKHVSLLHKRGLVTIQMDQRGVKYLKDFAGLYVLALEYHEWCESEDYIAPEAELAEFIRQDEHLVAKLRRFDNYRQILYKGIKLKDAEITSWYTSTKEMHHGE